jgi:hypothetical protein
VWLNAQGPDLPLDLHHAMASAFFWEGKVHVVGGVEYSPRLQKETHNAEPHFPSDRILVCDLSKAPLTWQVLEAPHVGGFTTCVDTLGRDMYCLVTGAEGFSMGRDYGHFLRIDKAGPDLSQAAYHAELLSIPKELQAMNHVPLIYNPARQEVIMPGARVGFRAATMDIWTYSCARREWEVVGKLCELCTEGDGRAVVHPPGEQHAYLIGGQNPLPDEGYDSECLFAWVLWGYG